MNINCLTNTRYVILWAIISIDSAYERIYCKYKYISRIVLKVIKMSLKEQLCALKEFFKDLNLYKQKSIH